MSKETLDKAMSSLSETALRVKAERDDAVKLLLKVRNAFTYDPGHSDLDNEQPIHISMTLGDWRRIDFFLRVAK